MTSLAIERFGTPLGSRDARTLAYAEDSALDDLSERTVWCATALSRGHDYADDVQARLRQIVGEELEPRLLSVGASQPVLRLAERLDAMLAGEAGAAEELGAAERELCADAWRNGDVLVGGAVRADDVVVLHDPLTAMLAEAVRERGAHAVWQLERAIGPGRRAIAGTRDFLQEYTRAVDAYVMVWPGVTRGRPAQRSIVALIPAPDVVAEKDIDAAPAAEIERRDGLGWATTLAEVTRTGRAETVGGTLHARPTVAAR